MVENTKNARFMVLKRSPTNPKIPFQGDHSKFAFIGCESIRNIPRRCPPWGYPHSLSSTRGIRISSDRLGKGLFLIYGKSFQNQKSWICRSFDHDKKYKNPTSSASIETLCRWSDTHLVDVEQSFKMVVSRPPYDQIRSCFFLFLRLLFWALESCPSCRYRRTKWW